MLAIYESIQKEQLVPVSRCSDRELQIAIVCVKF